MPGLPRLFFADQPEDAPPNGGHYGQDARPGDSDEDGRFPGRVPPPPPGDGQGAFGAPDAFGTPGQPGGQQAAPGQPGWGSAAQRQARRRPAKPPARELKQRAIASLVLAMLALVALLGLGADLHRGIWALMFSAAIGIGAAVIGISALVKARRTGSYRPGGAVGGIVLGVIAALISVPILVTYLAFPAPVNTYVKCLNQAQTSSQQQACVRHFYKSIHLGGISGIGGSG